MLDFITCCDFYKIGHRQQYPSGTQRIYSNFTARSTRVGGADSCVFFGLQHFLQDRLTDLANQTFFSRPRSDVLYDYQKMLDNCLGPDNNVGTEHIGALHDLQYIPLEFRALPEGTKVPFRMPMLTIENTHDDFFWVTNYIEDLLSTSLWLACTSASTAVRYRKILENYAALTGGNRDFINWQAHDFSFRGMASAEAAAISGAGHLLSFTGTDCIPAIKLLHDYYQGEGLIGGSVPATEHSVMCAGGQAGELETFRRLMKMYRTGILSVVSDSWSLWSVLGQYLPILKPEIMARHGKLVIRPDSGDPVLILTGDAREQPGSLPHKGVVETLWDLFGGTVNAKGYKELDSHIGAIYGDSITEERATQICQRLKEKGFASTNVVLGIGSYSYQFVTRDTNGFAIKATWAKVNDEERMLFKNPITDTGEKKSARGRIVVCQSEGGLQMIDGLTLEQQAEQVGDLLRPIWRDGRFLRKTTLAEIRTRLK